MLTILERSDVSLSIKLSVLADRINSRAYANVPSVRLSVTLCIMAKWYVLEQKLLLCAVTIGSSIGLYRLVPK